MTRRDFILIAETIADFRREHPDRVDGLHLLVWKLASRLATTNPNFDRARFIKACGVED